MLLMIDNYDSFTYNLYQYLCELGEEVEVYRNDKITVEDIDAMAPERIVISPGPGTPAEAGISVDTVRRFAGKLPLLGVCLGHQCIGEAFGGVVSGRGRDQAWQDVAGQRTTTRASSQGLPNPFAAVRYHSLAIVPETLPDVLEVSARSESGVIMGVRHKEFTLEGVQFHPESILTKPGKQLLANFLNMENRVKAGAS